MCSWLQRTENVSARKRDISWWMEFAQELNVTQMAVLTHVKLMVRCVVMVVHPLVKIALGRVDQPAVRKEQSGKPQHSHTASVWIRIILSVFQLVPIIVALWIQPRVVTQNMILHQIRLFVHMVFVRIQPAPMAGLLECRHHTGGRDANTPEMSVV